ncbi:MAG: glycosyltransferase family 2 protein [Gammaproteobacteria bacterium]|nr:glycosyltransferase family 2 protein [Gammaproteobacteria bacterium]
MAIKFFNKLVSRRRKDEKRTKAARIGVCTCAKDERPYLREWVSHYRRLGFDFIFVYDNGSGDSSIALLEKMAGDDLKIIEWPTATGKSPQLSAFEDCARLAASTCDFLAFFDADEFLVEQSKGLLRDLLDKIDDSIDGILVNQRIVGSNGAKAYRPLPVVQRFPAVTTERYPENKWVKSIVRPRSVQKFGNPHIPTITGDGRFVNGAGKRILKSQLDLDGKLSFIDHSGLALNHYILKSYEEYLWKRARGGGAAATQELRSKRYADDQFFINRELTVQKQEMKSGRPEPAPKAEFRREVIDELKTVPIPWSNGAAVLSRRQREWALDCMASHDSLIHFGISQAIIDAAYAGLSSIVVVSSSSKAIENLKHNATLDAAIQVGRLRALYADIGPVDDYGHPLDLTEQATFKNYAECPWNIASGVQPSTGSPLIINTGRFRVACACLAAVKDPASKILLRDFSDRVQYEPLLEFFSIEEVIDGASVLVKKPDVSLSRLMEVFDRYSVKSL